MSCNYYKNFFTKNNSFGFGGFDSCPCSATNYNYLRCFEDPCYSKNSSNGFGGFDSCPCNRNLNAGFSLNRESSFGERHSDRRGHSHRYKRSHRRRH